MWHALETVNAVTYFAAECREASAAVGLKGFWMGYFASRSAPFGTAAPGLVEATFFTFHPSRVRRAIPDAWRHVSPTDVILNRSAAAASALRRLLPNGAAEELATEVLPVLDAAVAIAGSSGRPLFAANRDVPRPVDPVAQLWQVATTLREHRGDGHVALLCASDLDGCEALVLFSVSEGLPPELFRDGRGWSLDEWITATDRLIRRGMVTPDGSVTTAGRELRDEIEARTDQLAAQPYSALEGADVDRVLHSLTDARRSIVSAGDIAFPNPMGLPEFSREP